MSVSLPSDTLLTTTYLLTYLKSLSPYLNRALLQKGIGREFRKERTRTIRYAQDGSPVRINAGSILSPATIVRQCAVAMLALCGLCKSLLIVSDFLQGDVRTFFASTSQTPYH